MRQYRYYVGRNSKQRLREAKLQAADYMILLLAGACLGTLSKVKGDTFGYHGYMYTIIAVSLLCKISVFTIIFIGQITLPERKRKWHDQSSIFPLQGYSRSLQHPYQAFGFSFHVLFFQQSKINICG